MERYDPQEIEARWQALWEAEQAFVVANPERPRDGDGTHTYVLEMLPYPSGELHMGHVFNYTLGDVLTHVRRRRGWTVLRPMGYDAFGLPAENAAIREGEHPRLITERNIAAIREQMRRMGWAIDWSREVSTADPAYYRWTQWLFLRFMEAGLAYRREAPVKWCPVDQTVLANEQVIDGRCERCGAEVEARSLEQWFFRITEYADRLLDEMALLESWPDRVLTMQRNWIGRSEGAEVVFRVAELDIELPVFTTRPDTLFGATFFVLAPEHPLVAEIVAGTEQESAVLDYVRHTAAESAVERAGADREKTGVFTGRHAVNPVNGERIPIWVGDYVLIEYGTGAIMAVPAHDERDFDFARQFGLPVLTVVVPAGSGRRRRRERSSSTPRTSSWSTPASSPGCRAPTGSARSWPRSRSAGSGAPRSATGCATGSSRASATGAARSRSCTASRAGSSPCPTTSSRCSCPMWTTTSRRGARRLPRPRTGCRRRAPRAVAPPAGRRTRWTRSWTPPGTTCATRTLATTRRRSAATPSTTGSPSGSTSAASSTRSSTCSTRASSRRR
jgi:leucyl-tRNA synthetase